MKIKREHYDLLSQAIIPLIATHPYQTYKNAGLTTERWRWDLFHTANRSNVIGAPLYRYLNDSHVDTALRSITGTK